MRALTAKGAKRGFGRTVAKHRRPAVMVMAVGEYEQLTTLELTKALTIGDEFNYCQAPI